MAARISRMLAAVALAALGTLTLVGCEDDAPTQTDDKSGTFYGASVEVGDGTARTYFMRDADGNPTEVGIEVTETALQGLPDGMGGGPPSFENILEMPAEAADVPFTHVTFDWNPHGHEPEGIYNLPHFDCHFYILTQQERQAMMPTNPDFETKGKKDPEAKYIPQGYILPPGSEPVPMMGMHWGDPSSPEFNGQPFSRTFIYGFYDGMMAFLEPMITKAYLETKPDFSQDLKLPESYPTSDYYPTNYSVKYDAEAKVYHIALGGMTMR